MKKVSLHELELLTGTNYQVLKKVLAAVPFTRGANRAHIYNSVDALRAIYTERRPTTLEEMKLQTETLNAKLKAVELAKRTKDLVPADFSFLLINTFIKYVASRFETLRLNGKVDREWIAECEAHWTQLFRQTCTDYELTLPPEASQTQQNS